MQCRVNDKMSVPVYYEEKSRRDGILSIHNVVPSGLWGESRALLVRRLKSTVNNMPSLRDFSPSLMERG